MTHSVARMVALLCGAWLALLGACGKHVDVLAELKTRDGSVEGQIATAPDRWKDAPAGTDFTVGDSVRTRAKSLATLRLADGSSLEMQEQTLLRFLERTPGSRGARLDLAMGTAEIQTSADPLRLETLFGAAVIGKNARLRISRLPRHTRLLVLVGTAQIEAGARVRELTAGESVEVAFGNAIVEPAPMAAAATPRVDTVLPSAADTASADGEVEVEVVGLDVRARAPGESDTVALRAGTRRLRTGTTLWLKAESHVELKRKGQQARLEGPGQYVIAARDGALVAISVGQATVSSASEDVVVGVQGGSITVHGQGKAEVTARNGSTSVNVQSGRVTVKGKQGGTALGTGEVASLARDGAVKVLRARSLELADFVVPGGGSFIVHDPHPPTAIGFRSPSCAGELSVKLARAGTRETVGEGVVTVAVPSGSGKYTLTCLADDHTLATGTVVVMRDAGTRTLPKSAPTTLIDADGRNYTVLYQNLLPRATVRWPNAGDGSYFLHLRSAQAAERVIALTAPNFSFPAGALSEGSHQLWFEGPAGKRSKPTSVAIQFDNDAAMATLSSPVDGNFASGSRVTVAGTALSGWVVSVDGQPLAQDGEHRFSSELAAPAGVRGLAVQFAHPQRGTHYYLRRSAR